MLSARTIQVAARLGIATCQNTHCQWRPRDDRQIIFLSQGDKFILNTAIQQVVGRLFADVAIQSIALTDSQGFHHHPGWMCRATNVTDFSSVYQIIKCT
jgi:hypothetical protein